MTKSTDLKPGTLLVDTRPGCEPYHVLHHRKDTDDGWWTSVHETVGWKDTALDISMAQGVVRLATPIEIDEHAFPKPEGMTRRYVTLRLDITEGHEHLFEEIPDAILDRWLGWAGVDGAVAVIPDD